MRIAISNGIINADLHATILVNSIISSARLPLTAITTRLGSVLYHAILRIITVTAKPTTNQTTDAIKKGQKGIFTLKKGLS